jgi:prevent-host-death family protein
MSKLQIITASELQRASGKVLKRVAQDNEPLMVERDGYQVAVILPVPEYEALMRLRAAAAHRQLARTLGARAEEQGLSERQFDGDLEATKQQLHKERYPGARTRR